MPFMALKTPIIGVLGWLVTINAVYRFFEMSIFAKNRVYRTGF